LVEEVARSKRLIGQIQRQELAQTILEVLPQGHESGLDADLLDGLHAIEIIAKAKVISIPSGGGGGGGVSDHGALTGLEDDDHLQYLLADGTRRMTGHLLPASSLQYNLGSSTVKWLRGYLNDVFLSNKLYSDKIGEYSSGMGVTIDNLLVKDGGLPSVAADILQTGEVFLRTGVDADGILPTPGASYRGKMIRVEGGAGVADKLYICMKAADESFSWIQIAIG